MRKLQDDNNRTGVQTIFIWGIFVVFQLGYRIGMNGVQLMINTENWQLIERLDGGGCGWIIEKGGWTDANDGFKCDQDWIGVYLI